MSTRKNNGTNNNAISVRDITLITDNMMLDKILNKTELDKARKSKTVESIKADGKTAVLNPVLREFYVDAYSKLDTVAENVVLAKRKLIVAVMDSDDFKKSFVSDKDFADSIGESKTFVSKAKSCVSTLNWLVENDFGMNWTASQLDEIVPILNKELKKDKAVSFKTMLTVLATNGKFTADTSSRKIRELLANIVDEYNAIANPVTDNESTDNESTDNESTDNESTNNESTDNESTDNESTDNESTDSKTPQESQGADLGICRFKLIAECNNGIKVAIEGKCAKGAKGDATYQQITKAIMSDKKLVEKLRKELEKLTVSED